jgi:glycosyltransferase A (GT-A) superfamily protein (DUF2064 family)
MIDTLIVLAKQPVAGRVKTRLTPPLTHDQAAELAAAALADTLAAVSRARVRRRALAFDAPAAAWLPAGWAECRQPAGGLDVRIAAAFVRAGRGATVLVGMDTPQVTTGQLTGFDVSSYDACLGPAADGGFWALGLREPSAAPSLIEGVPMSCAHTGAEQLDRLRAAGLRVQILEELTDVDTIADADRVAAYAPDGQFARAVHRVHRDRQRAS